MLPKERNEGGCTDRELRDVFYHLDSDYTGYIKIDTLLEFLFRYEKMPAQRYRSRIRKGGAAARKAREPLAFGKSLADKRVQYTPEGLLTKDPNTESREIVSKSLSPPPSESILRLSKDRREIFRKRAEEKKRLEMEHCTFVPNTAGADTAYHRRGRNSFSNSTLVASPIKAKDHHALGTIAYDGLSTNSRRTGWGKHKIRKDYMLAMHAMDKSKDDSEALPGTVPGSLIRNEDDML